MTISNECKSPFFSVCIPTFNTGHLIGEAIQSVLDNTFTDYEIIVSDNCSTDNTKEVVDSFQDDRIVYFCNPKNVGMYPNVTLCSQRATGKYIQILCADDKLSPFCLEVIYHQLAKRDFIHGAVGIGYSINESDVQIENLSELFNYKTCTVGSYNFFDYLNQKIDTNLGGFLGTICVKKDVLQEVGYFGEDASCVESDVITWKKIVLATKCLLIDNPILCYYRQHPNQVTILVQQRVTIGEYFDFFRDYKSVLLSLDPSNKQTIEFLSSRMSSFIITGISRAIKQKDLNYLPELLHKINAYGYRIPILRVLKDCLKKLSIPRLR